MSTVRERPASAAKENRSPRLYVSFLGKEPSIEGISIDLDGANVIEVGRGKTTTVERERERVMIRIADSELSSRHFEMRATTHRGAKSFDLHDLDSTNGTHVFGAGLASPRITGRHVLSGDCCVCAGSVAMHYVREQPSWGPRGLTTWAHELTRRSEGLASLIPTLARDTDDGVRLAATDLPLSLTGAAGSGRTSRARALHAWSKRAGGPFVVINAAIVTSTAENFFNGLAAMHGRAPALAGTFAAARGGTLFVRDVGKMSPAGQELLSRVLHTGEYLPVGATRAERFDARMMFSVDPADPAPVEALRAVTRDYELVIPPLRERMPDLGILIAGVLRSNGCTSLRFGADAVRLLAAYSFPGNLAQLASAVANAAQVEGGIVRAADLLLPDVGSVDHAKTGRAALLLRHMEDAGGNISEVARRMKTSRTQIHRWLQKVGRERSDTHEPD